MVRDREGLKSTLSNYLHLQMKFAAERRNQKIIDAQFIFEWYVYEAENVREFKFFISQLNFCLRISSSIT